MRDYTFMGITTACRTAVALGTLLILARLLGPSNFGFISIVVTWSTIAALITDYGFSMRALRDIGAESSRAAEIMLSSLLAKTALVFLMLLLLYPVGAFTDFWVEDWATALLFFLATIANSYGDLGLVAFRSLGYFHRETRVVLVSTIVHFALFGITLYLTSDLFVIGLIFLISRLIYSFLALSALSSVLVFKWREEIYPRKIFSRFRSSTSYALDSGFTNIFAQLDVIFVNQLAGREAAGVYFAGSRLLQGVVPFSVLLASIHIPRLAYRVKDRCEDLIHYSLRVLFEYCALGLFFSIVFFILGPFFTTNFLGSSYNDLNGLWPAFACFTFARFVAAGLGVQLIGLNTGLLRTYGIILSGFFTVCFYWVFIPQYGIQAAPWISTVGMVILIIVYGSASLIVSRDLIRVCAR